MMFIVDPVGLPLKLAGLTAMEVPLVVQLQPSPQTAACA